MSRVVVPQRTLWTRQPQVPVRVDPRYAVPGAVAYNVAAGVNLVSGRAPTLTTGGITDGINADGRCKRATGGGDGGIKFPIPLSSSYTVVFVGTVEGGGGGLSRVFSTFNGAGGHDLFTDGTGTLWLQEWWSSAGAVQWPIPWPGGSKAPFRLVVSFAAGDAAAQPTIFLNGVKVLSTRAGTPSGTYISGGSTLGVLCRPDNTGRQGQGTVNACVYLPFVVSDALAESLSENPWQIFTPAARPVCSAAQPMAMALAGLAQAVASTSGALAVGVKITGAAVSVATANGALSTAIAVNGAAAAIASAAGKLTLGVVLSGAAIAQSLAAGALGTRYALGGTAAAHAGASGNASSTFPLSGTATGQSGAAGHLAASSPTVLTGAAAAHAAATGTLTVQFTLSGAAVAQAAASGVLSVGGTSALAGTVQAIAAASGALSVSIPLAGNAQVVAGVTGNLTTGSPLSGAAVAIAAAAGLLLVTVKLSGTAVAQAIASGGLSLRVPLSGSAIARANASGVLSGGPALYVSNARFTVRARPRNFTVTHAH